MSRNSVDLVRYPDQAATSASGIDRRDVCRAGMGVLIAMVSGAQPSLAQPRQPAAGLVRTIPSTGEQIPAVGLGSWITFNVGNDPQLLARSTDVMRAFFESGGRMIDCSPMYGSSQQTIGHGLQQLGWQLPARDWKVLNGALCLSAIVGILGNFDFAHRVFFNSIFAHLCLS